METLVLSPTAVPLVFVPVLYSIDRSFRPDTLMREIQASEAKTHLPRLLDEVERGETVIITRHGRAIARIVPEAERRQMEIAGAIDSIRARRQRTGGEIAADELLSARHEGHKY